MTTVQRVEVLKGPASLMAAARYRRRNKYLQSQTASSGSERSGPQWLVNIRPNGAQGIYGAKHGWYKNGLAGMLDDYKTAHDFHK